MTDKCDVLVRVVGAFSHILNSAKTYIKGDYQPYEMFDSKIYELILN